jgi:hypothetical protein
MRRALRGGQGLCCTWRHRDAGKLTQTRGDATDEASRSARHRVVAVAGARPSRASHPGPAYAGSAGRAPGAGLPRKALKERAAPDALRHGRGLEAIYAACYGYGRVLTPGSQEAPRSQRAANGGRAAVVQVAAPLGQKQKAPASRTPFHGNRPTPSRGRSRHPAARKDGHARQAVQVESPHGRRCALGRRHARQVHRARRMGVAHHDEVTGCLMTGLTGFPSRDWRRFSIFLWWSSAYYLALTKVAVKPVNALSGSALSARSNTGLAFAASLDRAHPYGEPPSGPCGIEARRARRALRWPGPP